MPIEIRELHIKVHVESGRPAGQQPDAASTSTTEAGGAAAQPLSDATIAAIVEQVLDVLRMKQER